MTSLTTRLAAGATAVLAAAALAACGSASTGSSAMPAPPTAAPPAAAAYNATDVAFTTGIIRLEGQARALGGLVAVHTSNGQLRGYAAAQFGDDTDTGHMSGMLQRWHHALCREELRAGASRQARHLAQAMLTQRQAQLAQLQRWHHTMDHASD